jgi:hypothetical protein
MKGGGDIFSTVQRYSVLIILVQSTKVVPSYKASICLRSGVVKAHAIFLPASRNQCGVPGTWRWDGCVLSLTWPVAFHRPEISDLREA